MSFCEIMTLKASTVYKSVMWNKRVLIEQSLGKNEVIPDNEKLISMHSALPTLIYQIPYDSWSRKNIKEKRKTQRKQDCKKSCSTEAFQNPANLH